MRQSSNSIVRPRSLLLEIHKRSSRFRGYQQQDSHEFLITFFDFLTNEWEKAYKKKNFSIVHDVFGGLNVNQVMCLDCKRISRTIDPFIDISLPISFKAGDVQGEKMVKKLQGQLRTEGIKKVSPGYSPAEPKPVLVKKRKIKGRLVTFFFTLALLLQIQSLQRQFRRRGTSVGGPPQSRRAVDQ